ncbi:MAG: NAD(+)/NADH kinase [Ignavibacteria bacterium]|nr:NAD(+)/NADH kinase [Ignavibacteria bacterium]
MKQDSQKIEPPVAGIFGNLYKPEVFSLIDGITEALELNGFSYFIDRDLAKAAGIRSTRNTASAKSIISKAGVVLSLGGDGTFLSTAQKVGGTDIPILGVNLGRLGYFSEITPEEIEKFIPNLRSGKFRISEQVMLQAEAKGMKRLYGLNDIVIDKSSSIRMLETETFFNTERIVRIISDGIIVSTPSGSTAYSLSCNGPIVNPQSKVTLITPISPHTLNVRPIIVPDTEVIRIKVLTNGKARITSDGQKAFVLNSPCEFRICKAPFTIKAVKKTNSSYFHTLKKKLHWGEDIRHGKNQ